VLVQVTKDPIGHKGARLTSHVALSGRHLVYVPNGHASGISRKLSDVERRRLRDILKNLLPDGAGVIVRTAAEGAAEEGPRPRRQAAAGAVGGHPGEGRVGRRARAALGRAGPGDPGRAGPVQ
jgi:Ribonuclease G/E